MSILLTLYGVFFKVGLFAFGGGYSILALLQNEVVTKTTWLTSVQLTDIFSIAEMTPGPIFVNTATFVGYEIAGFWGSVVATLASITPAVCLTLVVLYVAKKVDFKHIINCVKIVVVAMIATAFISMARISLPDFSSVVIFLLTAYFSFKSKVNPIWLILGGGLAGLILFSFV